MRSEYAAAQPGLRTRGTGARRRRTQVAIAAASLAALASSGWTASPDAFAECERRYASAPAEYEASRCFYAAAQVAQDWDGAARRLDALRRRDPQNHWPTLVRGHLEWTRDPAAAQRFYALAAEGFAAQGHTEGEVRARTPLRSLFLQKGQAEAAGREVERVRVLAEASGEPSLLRMAWTVEALHLTETGEDLGRAYNLLRKVEAGLDQVPYTEQRRPLLALGNLCFRLGRWTEAAERFQRLQQLARAHRDTLTESNAGTMLVNSLAERMEHRPNLQTRRDLLGRTDEVLATARAARDPRAQIMLHALRGDLRSQEPGSDAEALRDYRACVALARASGGPRDLGSCLWSMGRFLARRNPAAARRTLDEALKLAAESGDVWALAFASRQRMRLSWNVDPAERATAVSFESLRLIEALRDLQPEGEENARLFATWTRDYRWLAGRLLRSYRERSSRIDLEAAFQAVERMRARMLLDAVTAARPARSAAANGRRQALHESIVTAHRRLLDPRRRGEEKAADLRELELLELEQRQFRDEHDVRQRRRGSEPAFPSLVEVEAALAPDEALLSFQLGANTDVYGDFAGGSWLLVSTRGGTRVIPLADAADLDALVDAFVGLFHDRQAFEAVPAASVRLFDEILRSALTGPNARLRRLIVVGDGALHRLPFGGLRSGAGEPPLAVRYELTTVPSATLWLRWRRAPAPAAEIPAVIFADPEILGRQERAAVAIERDALYAEVSAAGRLPYARREARSVVRHLGRGSRLLEDDRAAEASLKKNEWPRFAVLHLAAHAVVDESRPARSCVLLAPGGEQEDGLVQTAEIAELDLEGRLVVLSACRTASGALVGGEGVLGLARAFFQAGAYSVVASLWPLRDDDAASLFDAFYRHLGRGASVSAALRNAQAEAYREGRPAAAWAGIVALGDGAMRPVAAGPGETSWGPPMFALLLVVASVVAWKARRRWPLSRNGDRDE